MQSSLAITALMMGLLGGPHCVVMCGAACAGLGQAAGKQRAQALWAFQLGRLGGYASLGALACPLYTTDAADEQRGVDLCGLRILKT